MQKKISNKNKAVKTKKRTWGKVWSIILSLLIGFSLLSTALIWEHHQETSKLPEQLQKGIEHNSTLFTSQFFISLLSHLAIGAIVIGVLSIMLETSHWTEYFKERLAEIVMDKKYMEGLSKEALTDLQTDMLKVYFKDDEIAGKGGFLEYYQDHIQVLIASPFRENVSSEISLKYEDDTRNKIVINEKMTWICKSVGGNIQSDITWEPNKGEFETVKDLLLKLSHPDLGVDVKLNKETLYKSSRLENDGFRFSLKDYSNYDGLKVTLESIVVIPVNKFIAWRIAYPSKGISIAVRYPSELSLYKELLGIEGTCDELNDPRDGYYRLTSNKWVMPDEGIIFQLL